MKGVLFVNVGTPEKCTQKEVRRFIGTMLSDPLVTNFPKPISSFLAKKVIAPICAPSVTGKYSLIWINVNGDGVNGDINTSVSPLLYNMRLFASKFEKNSGLCTEIAMRYGSTSISEALDNFEKREEDIHEVDVFFMFPQYAKSSLFTAKEEIAHVFNERPRPFRLRFVDTYFNNNAYIDALAENAKQYLKEEEYDKYIFTYHSLPVQHVEEGFRKGKEFDYVYQLKETTKLLSRKFKVPSNKVIITFSSQRKGNWLRPYLYDLIKDLPASGAKRIAIMAPGFVVDNLETLYDIDIMARELFMKNGGEVFDFIPSLNDNPCWVEAVEDIIEQYSV